MNRITSALGIFTLLSVGATSSTSLAQVNDIELLKSRVSTLESRVIALENAAATSGATNVDFVTPVPPTPAPESKSYVIKEGDTVSEIARREKIPRTLLMEENGLREGQQIYIGDRLMIPTRPSAEAPNPNNIAEAKKKDPVKTPVADASGHTFYTVKYGDTLSKISRSTGASVASIKSANGLRNDIIGGGQRLKIPTSGSTAPISTPPVNVVNNTKKSAPSTPKYTNTSLNDNESYGEYTVEKGDNLYALARDFFTTMKELQRINGLGSSTLIHPGHKLIVPTSKYNEYHNKVATR